MPSGLGDREYEGELCRMRPTTPFSRWLRSKCSEVFDAAGNDVEELRALSQGPSQRACSFKSMSSFGSHYRVDVEEGMQHVTYDSGVAELGIHTNADGCSDPGASVDLARVGILKDILVLTYGNLNLVLMVVSWVAQHTELCPRLRRDAHGFWLANMGARPRETRAPYLLPSLAYQVQNTHPLIGFK